MLYSAVPSSVPSLGFKLSGVKMLVKIEAKGSKFSVDLKKKGELSLFI